MFLNKKNINKLFIITFYFSYGLPSSALASSICYTEEFYPNIVSIREGKHGLEFVAAGINRDKKNKSAPVIALTNDDSWDSRSWKLIGDEKCTEDTCMEIKQQCQFDIPKITLSVHEALKVRSFRYIPHSIDQTISSCVKHNDDIYFGISFYAGEGVSGVGGIGKYNVKTKNVEVRRPQILSDFSVTHIAFDGKLLWIATANEFECSGTPPAIGLIWYDWDKNIVQDSKDIGLGICGFVVHDIHITNKSAWVATDLGLSQTYRTNEDYNYGWEGGFRHYIPQINTKEVMKNIQCYELYADFLNNLPRDDDNYLYGMTYDQIFNNAAKFNPRALKSYVDSIKKDK